MPPAARGRQKLSKWTVSMSFEITRLSTRLTEIQREGKGCPAPLASFTEGARACLRRSGAREKHLKTEGQQFLVQEGVGDSGIAARRTVEVGSRRVKGPSTVAYLA